MLAAAPFSEALDDPAGDVFCSVDRHEPFAERGHEEGPNEEDGRFLTQPDMASIFVEGAARAVGSQLFFPFDKLGANRAETGSVL
jgi:hypothetical protein